MAENPFSITPKLHADISRAQMIALAIGVIFTGLTVAEYFIDRTQFFRSWTVGFLYPFAAGLGALAILMLQYMSGGAWGMIIRRQMEAGARTLPLLTVLFVPILFGTHELYNWADPAKVHASTVLTNKSGYLNLTWWLIRTAIVFVVWNIYSFVLNRLSAEEEKSGSFKASKSLMAWSSIGLVIYVLSLTSAGVDWLMSMNDEWFSTIYGFILLGGEGLTIVSVAIITTTLLMRESPMANIVTKKHLHDLGKLLFMFTLFWTYVSFSQLLIIWAGNLPEETSWYLDRMNGGWQYMAAFLLFFQWMLPFLILLSQDIKKNPVTARTMAIWILVVRLVDQIWLVEPNFHKAAFHVVWSDVTAPIGLGGVWAAYYLYQLKKRPLIPVNAPDLERALAHGRAH